MSAPRRSVDLVETQQQLLHRRHGLLDVAEHRLAGIESRLLRQIPDLDAVGRPRLAEEVLVLAGHDAQEGGLARAVAPDDANLGARKKRKVDALENFLVRRMNPPQVLHGEDVLVSHGVRSVLDSGPVTRERSSTATPEKEIARAFCTRAGSPPILELC